jgi:hypothetical protein
MQNDEFEDKLMLLRSVERLAPASLSTGGPLYTANYRVITYLLYTQAAPFMEGEHK